MSERKEYYNVGGHFEGMPHSVNARQRAFSMDFKSAKPKIVVYVRLLPSCGCEGDLCGIMSEIPCMCGCNSWVQQYEGLGGEHIEQSLEWLNAYETHNGKYWYKLLPGVFSFFWHAENYSLLVGKWSSVEEYKNSSAFHMHIAEHKK